MTDSIRTHFVKVGLALCVTAIVGGGVSAAGFTIPVVTSLVVRVGLAVLGLVLIVVGLLPRRTIHTFVVTSSRGSISVPQGTITNPSYKTTRFGGHESRIDADDFRHSEDGKRWCSSTVAAARFKSCQPVTL